MYNIFQKILNLHKTTHTVYRNDDKITIRLSIIFNASVEHPARAIQTMDHESETYKYLNEIIIY